MGIRISTTYCCSAICAYVYVTNQHGYWRQVAEEHDYEAYEKYCKTSHPLEEKKIEWKSWHDSIIKMLKKLIEKGKMTEEEAKEAYDKWVEDNPNPDPEEEAYDVTEEFAQHPIRIELPKKVEHE